MRSVAQWHGSWTFLMLKMSTRINLKRSTLLFRRF